MHRSMQILSRLCSLSFANLLKCQMPPLTTCTMFATISTGPISITLNSNSTWLRIRLTSAWCHTKGKYTKSLTHQKNLWCSLLSNCYRFWVILLKSNEVWKLSTSLKPSWSISTSKRARLCQKTPSSYFTQPMQRLSVPWFATFRLSTSIVSVQCLPQWSPSISFLHGWVTILLLVTLSRVTLKMSSIMTQAKTLLPCSGLVWLSMRRKWELRPCQRCVNLT